MFGIRSLCLGVSNIFYFESLDSFRKSVVDKVNFDIHMFKKDNYYKEDNMKIKYPNAFNMELVDPILSVYQLIYDETDSNNTNIIQYFIMHELGLCIKLDRSVEHMFYAWSFSHNTSVPTSINQNIFYLNTYTTVFAWSDGNSNKNIHPTLFRSTLYFL